MAIFSNKRRGSIILFVLISIATLSAVAVMFQSGRIHKKRFYESVGSEYGFIDDNGNLHGRKIVEREVESMCNLGGGVMKRYIQLQTGNPFLFKANAVTTATDRNSIIGLDNFGEALKSVRIRQEDIKHNSGMVVAPIKIFPLDNKIPFTPKFKIEVDHVIWLILGDREVKTIRWWNFFDHLRQWRMGKQIIKFAMKDGVTDVDVFTELPEWKTFFKGSPAKERKALALLRDSLCFGEVAKDVKAVNFFMANEYVQKAIYNAYIKTWKRIKESAWAAISRALPGDYSYDGLGLNLSEEEEDEGAEQVMANNFTPESFNEIYQMLSPEGRWKEKNHRRNPTTKDLYEITEEARVLLHDDHGTMSSYSKVIGISTSAYDEGYPAFKAEGSSYIVIEP